MHEIHRVILRQLFDPKDSEVTFDTHAKLIKIKNTEGKSLLGVLAGKSIAIPLSSSPEIDSDLKTMVQTNIMELNLEHHNGAPEKACRMIGLPFNALAEGFYIDGNAIGLINSLHIHPERHFATQEDFLTKLTEAFATCGLTVTVEESL